MSLVILGVSIGVFSFYFKMGLYLIMSLYIYMDSKYEIENDI